MLPPTTKKLFYRSRSPQTFSKWLLNMSEWSRYSAWPSILPDFGDMGHLNRKIDIMGRQVFNKSCSYCEDRCAEHPKSCQDNPLSSQTPTPESVDLGHQSTQCIHVSIMIPFRSLTFKWRRTCLIYFYFPISKTFLFIMPYGHRMATA